MKKYLGKLKMAVAGVLAVVFTIAGVSNAWAADGPKTAFTVSPMNQKIVLNPGESYKASFKVHAPGSNTGDVNYELSVGPFYVTEEYETTYEDSTDANQMVDWITIDSPKTGTLSPNEGADIMFTINVPNDAPAGGQYATIKVTSAVAGDDADGAEGAAANIKQVFQIAHLIFAEIAGNTVRGGEIVDTSVPGFLLSGDIKGLASIKNTGNVHGTAKYTLQVFPLFSDEEVYTNVEEPDSRTILPDRTLYNETVWDKTPALGIFNVVYTVEFEGVTQQVSKMVIKCPIWLLFIIIFIIAAIVIYFVMRARSRKNTRKRVETQ